MSVNQSVRIDYHQQHFLKISTRAKSGFTLVEMLVVLVILSMTTGLLASALPLVWQSFAKLEQKQLSQSVNLAAKWFRQSIEGAVLYHPDDAVFKGTADTIEFISATTIDDTVGVPNKIRWEIVSQTVPPTNDAPARTIYQLWYANTRLQTRFKTHTFDSIPTFNYIIDNEWQQQFLPRTATLPSAVAIRVEQPSSVDEILLWALATPINPVLPNIPPEMSRFGEYEF